VQPNVFSPIIEHIEASSEEQKKNDNFVMKSTVAISPEKNG